MHSLPLFIRLTGRPVILLGDGEMAAAKHALLTRAGACIVDETAAAAIAIVAIADDDEARAAIARLKSRSILVNAVDRPADCDFTLPAIVDRDPVLIAVGTGGASAGLAKALRQRLERLLPQSLGALARQLAAGRARLRVAAPEPAERRRLIDTALEEGGALDCLADHDETALARWLDGAARNARDDAGSLRHIVLTSDDPDDLTLRQARWLASADRICHTAAVRPVILARARADAVRERCDVPPTPPFQGVVLFVERR